MDRLCLGKETIDITAEHSIEMNYYVMKEEKFYEELACYGTAYGIEIEKVDGKNVERSIVKDITASEDKIYQLVNIVKTNKLMPVHLNDVVEDFLS